MGTKRIRVWKRMCASVLIHSCLTLSSCPTCGAQTMMIWFCFWWNWCSCFRQVTVSHTLPHTHIPDWHLIWFYVKKCGQWTDRAQVWLRFSVLWQHCTGLSPVNYSGFGGWFSSWVCVLWCVHVLFVTSIRVEPVYMWVYRQRCVHFIFSLIVTLELQSSIFSILNYLDYCFEVLVLVTL